MIIPHVEPVKEENIVYGDKYIIVRKVNFHSSRRDFK